MDAVLDILLLLRLYVVAESLIDFCSTPIIRAAVLLTPVCHIIAARDFTAQTGYILAKQRFMQRLLLIWLSAQEDTAKSQQHLQQQRQNIIKPFKLLAALQQLSEAESEHRCRRFNGYPESEDHFSCRA